MEGKSIKKWLRNLLLILSVVAALIVSGYLVFQSKVVQSHVISLITKHIAKNSGVDVSIKHVNIALFRKVILDDIYISDKQHDTLVFIDKLVANVDSLSFKQQKIHFGSIIFNEPRFNLSKTDSTYNFSFLFTSTSPTPPSKWKSYCSTFKVNSAEIIYSDTKMKKSWQDFFHFYDVNFELDNLLLLGSSEFKCDLKSLQAASKDGLKLEDFSTQIAYTDSVLTLSSIDGHTSNSLLQAKFVSLNFKQYYETEKLSDVNFNIDLTQLDLAFKDISFILESFKGKDFKAFASGEIKGKINDLRGKNVSLSVGDFTKMNGDFYINGLPNIEKMYLFLNLNESYANLNKIRDLDLPTEIMNLFDHLPAFLSNVGQFSYKGNFTGFLDDFVTYGTAYSDLGTITGDLSFKPIDQNILKVNGHVSTSSLDVGRIFENEQLGKLTLKGEVNGSMDINYNYNLKFKGVVDSVDYNHYKYSNIILNGNLQNKRFDGAFEIDDPNLKMNFMGKLDLVKALPSYEFVSAIKHADLKRLHIVDDEISSLSVNIDANFEGSNIDNVVGKLILSEIRYRNKNDNLSLSNVVLNNSIIGDSSTFRVESDLITGELKGRYNFLNIGSSLVEFYRRYLPSSYFVKSKEFNDINQFHFNFSVTDLEPLTRVFAPDLFIKGGFIVKGNYNPASKLAKLETVLPFVRYGSREVDNLRINIDANNDKFTGKAKADKLKIKNEINIYNLSIDSEGQNDQLGLNILWNNFGEKTYSGNLKTVTNFQKTTNRHPHLNVKIQPSTFYFADSLWVIDETEIQIDSSSIVFDKFNFHHNKQHLYLDGRISENSYDEATALIENVDLLILEPLLGEISFTGKLNGRVKISDLYQKLKLDLNLTLNDLSFEGGGYLGELTLTSKWNNVHEKMESEAYLIKDGVSVIEAYGFIDPLKEELDLNLEIDNTPISILKVMLPDVFYNQDGLAKGNLRIYGKLKHFMHDGVVKPIGKASFGISYIKTTYYTSDPVFFHKDSLIFSNMKFSDEYGNTGIFNGSIKHTNFLDMKYDMNIIANNILAMNTTSYDNESFYGTAFATGRLKITGEGDDILLAGDLVSSKGTNIYIPFETTESAVQHDYIEFINSSIQLNEAKKYNVVPVGLNMDFDVEVTPEAKVQIIFNSQIGDIIRGEGNGNLKVKMDKNFNISMYGNYEIEKGDYLFTLQNVINKKFSIERGGTLKWIGDPYNALVDISAVYRVKTSLYDLFVGTEQDLDLSRRIPVNCIINLSENLMQPKIDFKIELPTAEERIKDLVDQMIVSQEDINRQIISLLMMGRFYTPEFFAGRTSTTTGAELVGTTTTELFSNQLSNWLSKISDVWDIGINYRPGNDISDKQIELALSTQILNDRITLDGNIANNVDQSSTSGNFVGDFDLNIKLTDNGKLQFKAYTHSNDNLIYDTAPYTQGVGLTYREDFNSFSELLKRYKEFFSRKKNKKKKESDKSNEE